MSLFEQNNGILLNFVDYTSQFKDAMRNWQTKVRPYATFNQKDAKLAEIIIKRKLRIQDKVWAIGINKVFDGEVYNLYLRVGPQERLWRFSTWGGYNLQFSEGKNDDDSGYTTSLSYRSSEKEETQIMCLLRQIEGRPLKLRKLFNKENNRKFW